jgi:hypothetical protein
MTAYPLDTSGEAQRALRSSLSMQSTTDSAAELDLGAIMKPSSPLLRTQDDRFADKQIPETSENGSAIEDAITAGHWQPDSITSRLTMGQKDARPILDQSSAPLQNSERPMTRFQKQIGTKPLQLLAASVGIGVFMALVTSRSKKRTVS